MRSIKLPDGSLQFVGLGLPPMEVPGYTADAGDPARFYPNWVPCQYREQKYIRLPNCKKLKLVECCNKYNIPAITHDTCRLCIATDKVPINNEL